jgi:hypothetical protein
MSPALTWPVPTDRCPQVVANLALRQGVDGPDLLAEESDLPLEAIPFAGPFSGQLLGGGKAGVAGFGLGGTGGAERVDPLGQAASARPVRL